MNEPKDSGAALEDKAISAQSPAVRDSLNSDYYKTLTLVNKLDGNSLASNLWRIKGPF